jgi:hypothetical protein
MFHPFLHGKDEFDFLGFLGAVRGVREWEEGNGESGGKVERDTTDGKDGFHTHLNCRRLVVLGTGVVRPGRRKLDRPVQSGLLPAVPTSDAEPRRMEEDGHPPVRLGRAAQRCQTSGGCSRGHCHMPAQATALLPR